MPITVKPGKHATMLPWKHEVNVHHHAYAIVKSRVALVDPILNSVSSYLLTPIFNSIPLHIWFSA